MRFSLNVKNSDARYSYIVSTASIMFRAVPFQSASVLIRHIAMLGIFGPNVATVVNYAERLKKVYKLTEFP